ncbi:MAG: adenylyl-sulfate kinase [Nitrospirota bacterium]
MNGRAIWLTGLPGSGKTSIARIVKEKQEGIVILGMDEMRRIVTPKPTYSNEEREISYRSLVYTAKNIIQLGHDVIIDATGHKRSWRDLARENIKDFYEVYLRCPLEVCMDREKLRLNKSAPKDIYKKAKKGEPVPTDKLSIEKSVSEILRVLGWSNYAEKCKSNII